MVNYDRLTNKLWHKILTRKLKGYKFQGMMVCYKISVIKIAHWQVIMGPMVPAAWKVRQEDHLSLQSIVGI
jgi:hypothetical protein